MDLPVPPIGIMVEVPAVALAPELFAEAAFFSIGSNDLTQYAMAAARDNGAVAALNDVLHPAVIRLDRERRARRGRARHPAQHLRRRRGRHRCDPGAVARGTPHLSRSLRRSSRSPRTRPHRWIFVAKPESEAEAQIRAYKTVLSEVLDQRPSGTRQRLADALGKHRSFVTQITSPTYTTPIPQKHVATILSVCHFGPAERETFLAAYRLAHRGANGLGDPARKSRHRRWSCPISAMTKPMPPSTAR